MLWPDVVARILVFSALPVLLVAGGLTDGDGLTDAVGGVMFALYGVLTIGLLAFERGRTAMWGAVEAQSAFMQAAVHRLGLMIGR